MDVVFKKFDKNKDIQKRRILFIECFPENIGLSVETVEHYLWKFHSAPFTPPSHEYGVYVENELIGYYAAIPYRYNFFSKEIQVAMVCDVMTGAKARGKGVFTKLGGYSNVQFQKAGLIFSSTFPIRAAVLPGFIKDGWNILFDLPLYARFLKFNTYLKTVNSSYLIPFFNFCTAVQNVLLKLFFLNKKDICVQSYSAKKDLSAIPGLIDFLKEWQRTIPISLVKDEAFLKWRLGAPDIDYHISIVRKKDEIVGYSICRFVIKQNVPCVGILDMCLHKNCYNLSKYLIKDIVKYSKMQKAEFIFLMMSKYWAKQYSIWKSGFLKTKYKFHYILKKLNLSENEKRHLNTENWHLMWIDCDDL